jgi:hypothetical protein
MTAALIPTLIGGLIGLVAAIVVGVWRSGRGR